MEKRRRAKRTRNEDARVIVKLFKRELKRNGQSIVWFQKRYLPEMEYQTVYNQINGQTKTLSQDVLEAIKLYTDK